MKKNNAELEFYELLRRFFTEYLPQTVNALSLIHI